MLLEELRKRVSLCDSLDFKKADEINSYFKDKVRVSLSMVTMMKELTRSL